MMDGITKRNASVMMIIQIIFLVLFGVLTEYEEPEFIKNFHNYSLAADASHAENSVAPTYGGIPQENVDSAYSMFQDVHVMIYIGFGFLMTFLKRYGFSSVGFNFLLSALVVQWAMILGGLAHLNSHNRMEISLESLFHADIAAASVLISMGALLGRTSYMQLLVMGLIEIPIFVGNSYLGSEVFKVSDAGGSIFVHAFGAYFGLAASWAMDHDREKDEGNALESSRYTSDLFAMIGTIFLWLFWPSFNAIEAIGDDQQRAIINTYLALTSCCVTSFAMSLVFCDEHKFDMVHVQNSTLAGGVAIGTAANLMIQPWGSLIVGVLAGILSVCGYSKLSPIMRSRFGIKDTCGVHNLHGMPAVLGGVIGGLMAALATEKLYHSSLYQIYPAMAGGKMTATPEYPYLAPGDGRSAGIQAGYQFLALGATLVIAIVTGLITGFILNSTKKRPITAQFDDALWWVLPEGDDSPAGE